MGDNVGDCAGMAADIFESYEVTIVSALILGLALVALTGQLYWIVFPLLVRAIGVISSIVGTFSVPVWERTVAKGNAWHAMEIAYEVSSVITITLSFVLAFVYIKGEEPVNWWQPAAMVSMGVIFNVIVNRLTAYFTATDKSPVQEIAKSTRFGPATTILSGLAEGYESSTWSVLTIAAAIMTSVLIYGHLGAQYVIYGVALIGIGWLTHAGNLVSMDSFGPISDNANGIGEMAKMPETRPQDHDRPRRGRQHDQGHHQGRGDRLRGHRGRGALRFVHHRHRHRAAGADCGRQDAPKTALITVINIADPRVFVGFLIGGGVPILFGALLVKAVSRAANGMVAVVRKEFDMPGVREGTVMPDYTQGSRHLDRGGAARADARRHHRRADPDHRRLHLQG